MTGAELDTNTPHSARVYDYLLGGKDNFAADRALGDRIKAAVPEVPMMIRANWHWTLRVTRFLAGDAGIRQFLDLGAGLPTSPNLHEVAQRIASDCRVVYVDNDPLVLAHARALLTSSPQGRCEYLHADLRDIDAVLSSPVVADTFAPAQPVAIACASMLMLLADADDPAAIVDRLRDWAPPGSYLAISHPTADIDPTTMATVVQTATASGMTFVPRTKGQVAGMFGDWDFVDPGLVPVLAWRPDQPEPNPRAAYYWTGVARKPSRTADRAS